MVQQRPAALKEAVVNGVLIVFTVAPLGYLAYLGHTSALLQPIPKLDRTFH